MFFSLKDLEQKPKRFELRFEPGEMEFVGSQWRQTTPLLTEGVAELMNETLSEIRVRGRFQVTLESDCDRCLEPAPVAMEQSFSLLYRPEEFAPGSEEVEIAGEESEVGFYQGDGVDLKDILRELILLGLPMHALCREDCAGICPQCGTNRNHNPCDCASKKTDDRWAALKNLKV